MTKMTPEQEAAYALNRDLPRANLSEAAKQAYDRLREERQMAARAAEPRQQAQVASARDPSAKKEPSPVTGDPVSSGDGAEPSITPLQERHRLPSLLKRFSVSRRLWASICLVLVGLALLSIGYILLPTTVEASSPPSLTLLIKSAIRIRVISYTSWTSDGGSVIVVGVGLPAINALRYPHARVSVQLIPNIPVNFSCTTLSCGNVPIYGPETVTFNKNGWAHLKSHLLGYNVVDTYSDTQETVSLPQIEYEGPGNPLVGLGYPHLPFASSYDWSSFPPLYVDGNLLEWTENLTNDMWPSRDVIGVNHANQQRNDRDTFLAGAIVGLGGGALIGGLQEGLHVLADRRNKPTARESAADKSGDS